VRFEAPENGRSVLGFPRYIPWLYLLYTVFYPLGSSMTSAYAVVYSVERAGLTMPAITLIVSVVTVAAGVLSLFSGAIVQWQERISHWLVAIPLVSGCGSIVFAVNFPLPMTLRFMLLLLSYACAICPVVLNGVVMNTLMLKVAGPEADKRQAVTSMMLRGRALSLAGRGAAIAFLMGFMIERNLNWLLWIAVVFTLLWLAAGVALYLACRPYEDEVLNPGAANIGMQLSLMQMSKAVVTNRPFLVLVFCAAMTSVAEIVLANGLGWFYVNAAGDVDLQMSTSSIMQYVTLGAAFICPLIARRIGKRESFMYSYVWAIVIYVLVIIFADANAQFFLIATGAISVGAAISGSWGANLLIDTAEVSYYETGYDNRPFVMSLSSLSETIAMFLSIVPFVPIVLSVSGYTQEYGATSLNNPKLFLVLWIGIVIVFYIIALLAFAFGYQLMDDEAEDAAFENYSEAEAQAQPRARASSAWPSPALTGRRPAQAPIRQDEDEAQPDQTTLVARQAARPAPQADEAEPPVTSRRLSVYARSSYEQPRARTGPSLTRTTDELLSEGGGPKDEASDEAAATNGRPSNGSDVSARRAAARARALSRKNSSR